MKKTLPTDFNETMVQQFRYPADPDDRYLIIQELPQTVTLQLIENGLDLPMSRKQRRAIIETDYVDVIDKLVVYGCDNPTQWLLNFNPLERGAEAVRRATPKQMRALVDLFSCLN
ncbi:MAG: hypothetical protein MUF49_05590 [Oculatellaceae cyanobacterium Prado106]|jgi:hypothetical protein|nr:hypothetical protein [Oculatellaceae cyanobacterium Prado106]